MLFNFEIECMGNKKSNYRVVLIALLLLFSSCNKDNILFIVDDAYYSLYDFSNLSNVLLLQDDYVIKDKINKIDGYLNLFISPIIYISNIDYFNSFEGNTYILNFTQDKVNVGELPNVFINYDKIPVIISSKLKSVKSVGIISDRNDLNYFQNIFQNSELNIKYIYKEDLKEKSSEVNNFVNNNEEIDVLFIDSYDFVGSDFFNNFDKPIITNYKINELKNSNKYFIDVDLKSVYKNINSEIIDYMEVKLKKY